MGASRASMPRRHPGRLWATRTGRSSDAYGTSSSSGSLLFPWPSLTVVTRTRNRHTFPDGSPAMTVLACSVVRVSHVSPPSMLHPHSYADLSPADRTVTPTDPRTLPGFTAKGGLAYAPLFLMLNPELSMIEPAF